VKLPAPLPFRFVTSADSVDRLPPSPAEVAVVGRSNVGKSSLLNAVAGRTALAKVSKTPGRTQLLNCFALDGGGTLIDCPGYGYAKTSKSMRHAWAGMIERYLIERECLEMVLVLVDGEIGPTKLDAQMLDWLRAEVLPHTVVATKVDKVKSSQRPRRRRDLAAACQLEPGDVVWTSAAKGIGLDQLRSMVALWLGLA
jgi:GTP-binding protein